MAHMPFGDGTETVEQAAEPARERTIMVAATLNLLIGTLLLAWGVMISLAVQIPDGVIAFFEQEGLGDVRTSTIQMLAVAAALPLAQIITGIALLVNASWGRWLTLIWAATLVIFGLPVVVFGLAGVVVAPYAAGVVMVLFAPRWRPALIRMTRTSSHKP